MKHKFDAEVREIAKAVLADDPVAVFALRDFLNELDAHAVMCGDKKPVPSSWWAKCEACEERNGNEQRKYVESPLRAEYGDLASLDDTLTLICWWCFCNEKAKQNHRRMVYETYTVTEMLLEAGIMRPSAPCEYDTRIVRVWEWWKSPLLLRWLSTHGGDEDWVALIPPEMDVPSWMADGTAFGCCSVQTVNLAGWTVAIGAHA